MFERPTEGTESLTRELYPDPNPNSSRRQGRPFSAQLLAMKAPAPRAGLDAIPGLFRSEMQETLGHAESN